MKEDYWSNNAEIRNKIRASHLIDNKQIKACLVKLEDNMCLFGTVLEWAS